MQHSFLNTSEEMIDFLKEKNIKLSPMKENDVSNFLNNKTYFFKLFSYRKNFEKEHEKYINLNFQKLVDISTIDMRLRYLLLEMCLDIEHTIKTIFVNEIIFNNFDNGYNFLNKFIIDNQNPTKLKNKIWNMVKRTNNNLYSKNKHNMPLWVVIECCDFGMLESIISYYLKSNPNSQLQFLKINKKKGQCQILLQYIRNIRNKAAHNAVMLNSITTLSKDQRFTGQLNYLIKQFINESNESSKFLNKNAHIETINDLTTLFLVYDKLIPSGKMKQHRYEEIKKLIIRVQKNRSDYTSNLPLQNTFKYFFTLFRYLN